MITGETRLFPIIGDPIMYVQSPQRVTASLAGADKNAVCIPMQVAENDLAAVMSGLAAISNVDGLLITMPHKSAAHAYCSTSSPTSRLLGVVSVMRRNADGSWHGDMLDGMAFVNAQVKAGAKLQGARVLLLGAGGAGSAIAVAMLDRGIRELVIYDRNPAQAAKLVQTLSDTDDRVAAGSPDQRGFDVICNATPMGMTVGDPLPISADLLEANAFVGDVISGHGETPLVQAARARGLRTANGDQMVDAVQSMMLEFLLGGARLR